MNSAFYILLAAAGLYGSSLIDTHYPPVRWNPLGLKGSWAARWLSRTLTDQADDAYHGGAKHDVKFSPVTPLGKLVERVVGGRGEDGRTGRQRSDEQAQLAYAQSVRNWLQFARDIDPSNFNSFFVYHNWLVEGFAEVEVGGNDGHSDEDPLPTSTKTVSGEDLQNLREAMDAVSVFLQNIRLHNSLDCTNAAIAVWMEYETETKLFPERKSKDRLKDVLRKMQTMVSLGDYLGRGRSNSYDFDQSRQYANAIIRSISDFLSQQ